MPSHSVNVTAAQAPREPLVLNFSESDSLTMDYTAWVQLQSRDDVTFTSGVDLDNSGTPPAIILSYPLQFDCIDRSFLRQGKHFPL